MERKTSSRVKNKSGSLTGNNNRPRHGTATYIKFVTDRNGPAGDSLDLLSTELGNDAPPFADGRRADSDRPRDIRGSLKVIDNVLFEHEPMLTAVYREMQPQFRRGALTLVDMDHLPNPEDRLKDAMRVRRVTAVQLARACGVSRVAVNKWTKGGKMTADNYAAASRALGVAADWLRAGTLPREREFAAEERELDVVYGALELMQGPVAALSAAIEKLAAMRSTPKRRREK